MNAFRVDKSEQPVVLSLSDGATMSGKVYLSDYAGSHDGRQTLDDLLDEPGDFFPFSSDSGSFRIVSKAAIACLLDTGDPGGEPELPPGEKSPVEVRLEGGLQLSGTLIICRPEGVGRLLDYLNASGRFFPLYTADGRCLVNLERVRDISPG